MILFSKFALSPMLAGLCVVLAGCNNGLDLKKPHSIQMQDEPSSYDTAMQALSVSELASAERYLGSDPSSAQTAVASPQLQQFAGRYTGQISCLDVSAHCEQGNIDVTLTLLPDGSAIQTLTQQGKVNAMLDKGIASWTVEANGQRISLSLPNQEVRHFDTLSTGQLHYVPASQTRSLIQHDYVLTTANF